MQDSDLESCDWSLSEAGDCGSELESCEWSEDDTQGHRRTPTAVVDLIPECDWSESTESEVSIGKGQLQVLHPHIVLLESGLLSVMFMMAAYAEVQERPNQREEELISLIPLSAKPTLTKNVGN